MQQYYPSNLDNDPIRNSQITTTELLPRENIFNIMKKNKNNNKNTFNNSNNQQQPDLYRENIFTENYNRTDGLNQEMIEKDKRIQELEFKLQQIEFEKDSFKNKLGIVKKYEEENKILTLKLKDEYEKNKEIVNLKNKLSLFKKSKGEDDRIISELRKKLNSMELENDEGISLNLMDTIETITNDDDDDEEIKEINYDEIYKKTIEVENTRNKNLHKYKNDKLKGIITKYLVNVNDNYIDDIFIKLKINENMEITKELISKIIFEIKQ
jgi:hypothetical protein